MQASAVERWPEMAGTRRQPTREKPLVGERVTVNLTPRAAKALDEAVALTGDNKTDTVNRALQVYSYVEQALHAGGDLYVRRSPDAEPELVKVL